LSFHYSFVFENQALREEAGFMSSSLSVSAVDIDHQQSWDDDVFPMVLQCDQDFPSLANVLTWVAANRKQLCAHAEKFGAVLFRGFSIADHNQFDKFVTAFEFENFPYDQSLSNAVRVNYTPRVFSANEAPADITIYLHHEMAQTPIYPSKLFFYCEDPADQGGATPICRSDKLLTEMVSRLPEFTASSERLGLKYSNVMPAANDAKSGMGRSWQSTFRAETQPQAEQRMTELGYSWQWLDDGCLRATTPVLPAIREVSGGRKTFFNQLIAAFKGWKDSRNDPSKSITFGDGTPLDRDTVLQVAEIAEELTYDLQWQAGDVALVDNMVAMHGRRTFSGTRKVLASLVATAD
jgi:hypothetical protein